jgi:hypothetical protein
MLSSSTRHCNEPTSTVPGTTRERVGDPANVGQRPSGWAGGVSPSERSASARVSEVRPLSARRAPRGVRIRRGERLEVAGRRRLISQGRPGEQLLRGDPRQVDARVGVDQPGGGRRIVRDQLAIRRDRLGEPGRPGRRGRPSTRGHHLPTRCRRPAPPPGGAPRGPLPPRPGDTTFGLGVDAIAVDRTSLGGECREPALAELAQVDVEDRFAPSYPRTGRPWAIGRPCRRTAGSPADRFPPPRPTGRRVHDRRHYAGARRRCR